MFKIKKIMSLALACSMVLSMGATAFAEDQESSNLEIITLTNNISQQTINEITSDLGASIVYDDGSVVDIPAIVTIEEIFATTRNLSDLNRYAVTLSAKWDTDCADKNTNNTSASATLKLRWFDGPGLENVLEYVETTLDLTKGEVEKGTLEYGNGWLNVSHWKSEDVGSSSKVQVYPNLTLQDPSARYILRFKNDTASLLLKVSASIFD